MYFATIDGDGRVTGFYSSSAPTPIPKEAIPITTAQYMDWLQNQFVRAWRNGELVTVDPLPPTPLPIELQRQLAMPTAQEQLDALLSGDAAKMTAIKAKIAAVNQQFPIP